MLLIFRYGQILRTRGLINFPPVLRCFRSKNMYNSLCANFCNSKECSNGVNRHEWCRNVQNKCVKTNWCRTHYSVLAIPRTTWFLPKLWPNIVLFLVYFIQIFFEFSTFWASRSQHKTLQAMSSVLWLKYIQILSLNISQLLRAVSHQRVT